MKPLLLSDWLKKHGEPAWVATLVDRVNEQLRVLLKGPHLQVGHSHFMVKKEPAGATVLTDAAPGAHLGVRRLSRSSRTSSTAGPTSSRSSPGTEVLAAYGPDAKSGTLTETAPRRSEDVEGRMSLLTETGRVDRRDRCASTRPRRRSPRTETRSRCSPPCPRGVCS